MPVPSRKVNQTKVESKNIEQLQSVVHRYCLSLTKSSWDAEDLAQETLYKGLKTTNLVNHNNLEALLLRIAKNTWVDQTRRNGRLNRILSGWEQTEVCLEEPTEEVEEILYGLMTHLSPLQMAVFLLRDVLGYSAAESAEQLHTSIGAVKAALHRAREALGGLKRDLEEGTVSLPQDEGMKGFLSAFAAAFQSGNTALLIKLALQDAVDPAIATAMVQNAQLQQPARSRTIRAGFGPDTVRQAAA
ncbi:sigma-70 family RNA polymerase sigma factor [Paenibacillus harenae]|uniref:sigma-70 family RNA polymerase sigma factor n=1 Tax=Paenibacillus harenae TaxID=306543 RepID=UPI0003F71D30|nr:sigma-70 family RNA polymerase sigma factor [Paenibacillus harenae]